MFWWTMGGETSRTHSIRHPETRMQQIVTDLDNRDLDQHDFRCYYPTHQGLANES